MFHLAAEDSTARNTSCRSLMPAIRKDVIKYFEILVLFILPSFNVIGLLGDDVGGVMSCELPRPIPTEMTFRKRNNTRIISQQ